jgi:hypothetical protein
MMPDLRLRALAEEAMRQVKRTDAWSTRPKPSSPNYSITYDNGSAHGLSVGNAIAFTGGDISTWSLASVTATGQVGVIVGVPSANIFTVGLWGYFKLTSTALNAGAGNPYYLTATAGTMDYVLTNITAATIRPRPICDSFGSGNIVIFANEYFEFNRFITGAYKAVGTGNFTVPAGVYSIFVIAKAGGGGGGGHPSISSAGLPGTGGGEGGTAIGFLAVSPGETVTIAGGGGGAGGVGAASGASGGDVTVSTVNGGQLIGRGGSGGGPGAAQAFGGGLPTGPSAGPPGGGGGFDGTYQSGIVGQRGSYGAISAMDAGGGGPTVRYIAFAGGNGGGSGPSPSTIPGISDGSGGDGAPFYILGFAGTGSAGRNGYVSIVY